tara:strand:+ start:204 stop:410 length:207 start_codon:yes stop_codon:yes gene_type:complete
MSHFSIDIIADQAIDTVCDMSDQAINDMLKDVPSSIAIVPGDADMDKKRDILIDIVFQRLLDRPGPHG